MTTPLQMIHRSVRFFLSIFRFAFVHHLYFWNYTYLLCCKQIYTKSEPSKWHISYSSWAKIDGWLHWRKMILRKWRQTRSMFMSTESFLLVKIIFSAFNQAAPFFSSSSSSYYHYLSHFHNYPPFLRNFLIFDNNFKYNDRLKIFFSFICNEPRVTSINVMVDQFDGSQIVAESNHMYSTMFYYSICLCLYICVVVFLWIEI